MSVRTFSPYDAAKTIEILPVRDRERAVGIFAKALRANALAFRREYQGRHEAECPVREVAEYEREIHAELARRGAEKAAVDKDAATDFLFFIRYNSDFDDETDVAEEILAFRFGAVKVLGPRVVVGPC